MCLLYIIQSENATVSDNIEHILYIQQKECFDYTTLRIIVLLYF